MSAKIRHRVYRNLNAFRSHRLDFHRTLDELVFSKMEKNIYAGDCKCDTVKAETTRIWQEHDPLHSLSRLIGVGEGD